MTLPFHTAPAFTPREIVSELDRHIIGQQEAKRAVAIALRNRWRRMQLDSPLREEVLPKNILMMGPTGVGKTEIARRLAKLTNAPFAKVEATKFTEIGYVGRDVEQIIRDLVDVAVAGTRTRWMSAVSARAEEATRARLLDSLVGTTASIETREKFALKLEQGLLDEKEIDIEVEDTASNVSSFDVPGMPGSQMGMINLGDMLGKAMGPRMKLRKMPLMQARKLVHQEECDKLLDQDKVVEDALTSVEQNGIVFIDEIDKICARTERTGGDVSREGVQRDLLPLIEGTTVSTKYGMVKTDHILFIASGAFHIAKPSDLLPELQGRLPIRVELKALSKEDFVKILNEPESSLIKQYIALMSTESVHLSFAADGIEAIATLAEELNNNVENIGARRLHAILEKALEEVSYSASESPGAKVIIDASYVQKSVANLAKNIDLARFIL